LWESASRLYGDEMERLWGEMKAVPEENLHALSGGEEVEGFAVEYTPGHASHHVSYFRDDVAYCGDVAGVRIPPADFAIPPTPPPDIDLEAWHASIDVVAARNPRLLALTHFGGHRDAERHLGDLSRRLDAWAALVRDEGEMAFLGRLSDEVEEASADDLETIAAFTQAAPPEQQYAGLARYWSKRAA
jgi:glyoxylase-like metal-dependent hydrolase (beta-lactamase superfamily II)